MKKEVSKSITYDSPLHIALVIDKKNKLKGIVTKGDLREGMSQQQTVIKTLYL